MTGIALGMDGGRDEYSGFEFELLCWEKRVGCFFSWFCFYRLFRVYYRLIVDVFDVLGRDLEDRFLRVFLGFKCIVSLFFYSDFGYFFLV